MPLYKITKTFVATVVVECRDSAEAEKWEAKIVGSLENEDGSPIPPSQVEEFEADYRPRDVQIELLN